MGLHQLKRVGGPAMPRTITFSPIDPDDPRGRRRLIGEGGTYVWEIGDEISVDEWIAREVMRDRKLSLEFECRPPLPGAAEEPADEPAEDDDGEAEG